MTKINITKVLIILTMIFAKETLTAQWTGTNPITTNSNVNIGGLQFGRFHVRDRGNLYPQEFGANPYFQLFYLSRDLGTIFPRPTTTSIPTWGFDINTQDKRLSISFLDVYNQPATITGSSGIPSTTWPIPTEIFSINTNAVKANVEDFFVKNYFTISTTNNNGVMARTINMSLPLINSENISGKSIIGNANSFFLADISVNNNAYFWSDIRVTKNAQFQGKVRIGSKTATFHPDAKLFVEGKVAAQHFVITKPTNWSDKVFQKGYKLWSLYEIEQFINQNKHLPDVPSEAEVMEKGYDANEMDAILLQKIEELTLFSIEQNKKVNL